MLIVNLVGIAVIALIIWWFWLHKSKAVEATDGALVVRVEDGTYQPSRIKLKANQPAVLQFIRKDASPCSETLLFPELEISETLPLNQPKNIQLPALKAGEYSFHCQMQMYRGVLTVQ